RTERGRERNRVRDAPQPFTCCRNPCLRCGWQRDRGRGQIQEVVSAILLQKRADRRFAHFPREYRRSINWKIVEPALACVAVVPPVRPDCAARLWPQNPVDGAMVITSTGKSAL